VTPLDRRVAALEQAAAEAADRYRLAGMAVAVAREAGVKPSTAMAHLRQLWALGDEYSYDVMGLTPEQDAAMTQEEIDAGADAFLDWLARRLDFTDYAAMPARDRRLLDACIVQLAEETRRVRS
jgi:hypothetical protein